MKLIRWISDFMFNFKKAIEEDKKKNKSCIDDKVLKLEKEMEDD